MFRVQSVAKRTVRAQWAVLIRYRSSVSVLVLKDVRLTSQQWSDANKTAQVMMIVSKR